MREGEGAGEGASQGSGGGSAVMGVEMAGAGHGRVAFWTAG